jgi:Uma2 family endonuclease
MATVVEHESTLDTRHSDVTADEFYELARGRRAELIGGKVIWMTPAGGEHGTYAGTLHILLGVYVRANRLGRICAAETGFYISRDPDTVRAPDVAFVSNEKLAGIGGKPSKKFWPFAPDLAVEVVSPGDTAEEIETKTREWFSGGTQEVWIVYPSTHTIHLHRSASEVVVLQESETLTGGAVLPGFECAVAEIFA